MHNNSIQTQFFDDNDYNGLSILPTRSTASYKKNKQQMQISALQDMIAQYTESIKHNKPIIEQLECQRKFFKKLCQKQKDKIQSINVQVIRKQYELKMSHLKQEKQRLHQTIGILHDQSDKNSANFQITLKNVLQNRDYLLSKLMEVEQDNKIYQNIHFQKCNEVQKLSYRVNQKQKILVQKEIIQGKYKELLKQIQKIQKTKPMNKYVSNFT